ncbi:MAG: hypothetical protein K2P95_02560, partial [Hyphomonadaceae bacterium]|nr:hypothetical protein [Hyphomonadaceae bacterium]
MTGVALAALVFAAWAGLLVFTQGVLPLRAAAGIGLPLLALQCWLFVGLFILAHDAMHGSLAP